MYKLTHFFRLYPKSIWWLTFIEIIFISRKTIFRVNRDVGDYSATVDSSTSLALFGIFISLIYIFNKRNEIKHIHKIMGGLLIFYYFSALSFIWAGNVFTILFKATEVIINIYIVGLIIINLLRHVNIKGITYYIIIFCLICTYCEVFIEMVHKGFGFHHTNAYSFTAMISLLLCFGSIKYRIFKLKEIKWCLILSLMAVIGGTSTATYISCIIGFLILYSSNKKGINISRTFIIICLCFLSYYFFFDIIYDFIRAGHTEEEMKSLTGRKVIWEASMLSFRKHSILGAGFVVGERNLGNLSIIYNFHQLSAHNSFLSALVNTGIIGFLLFVFFLKNWLVKLFTHTKHFVWASILFPIAIAIIVNCNSCPGIGSDWGHVSSCIYIIIGFSSPNIFKLIRNH